MSFSDSSPQMPSQPVYTVQHPELPRRGGAIATLVTGVLILLLIAPSALFFGPLIGGFSQAGSSSESDVPFFSGASSVKNGEVITVGQTGIVSVFSSPSATSTPTECSLESVDRHVPLFVGSDPEAPGYRSFTAVGVPQGTYTLRCLPEASTADFSLLLVNAEDFLMGVGYGLLIGSLISVIAAFIGIVVIIIGIVLLVKVHNRRKALLSQGVYAAY